MLIVPIEATIDAPALAFDVNWSINPSSNPT
jgi:hypothetical protein